MTLVMADAYPAGNADETKTSTGDSNRSTMYSYGRELCFLFALLLTAYAAINISQPRISKAPPAVPFFQTESVVEDFYDGQMSAPLEQVSRSDIGFVMYYAPWDAECQKVRWHFEATARYHQKEVYFAAINCWQPGSECRLHFPKIRQFPVLMLYPQRGNALQYQGVREASHMIHFLRSAIRPLIRLVSASELPKHMAQHDVVVVGFFDFNGTRARAGFRAFFDAAIAFLERDPLREVLFAVVTDKKTAAEFGVVNSTSIRLYLWNETVTMDPVKNLFPENITRWVTQNIHQVAVWVSPPGVKSLTLATYMQEGPVLLLFMPRNPLLGRAIGYQLLREVGLEFFNCGDSVWVQTLAKHIASDIADWQQTYKSNMRECSEWRKFREQQLKMRAAEWCESEELESALLSNLARWSNSTTGSSERIEFTEDTCPTNTFTGALGRDILVGRGSGSVGWQHYFGTAGVHELHCPARKQASPFKQTKTTSMYTGEDDERSPANLRLSFKDERCRELRHARLLDKPIYSTNRQPAVNESRIKGMACRVNRSLSFLALDSLQLHQFSEGLGVDVLSRKDKTAVFIVRPEEESHYLLEGEVTKESLVDFILKYMDNKLPRWLRSSEVKSRAPGLALGPTQTLHLNRYAERSVPDCGPGTVCVKELSYTTFNSEVLNNDKHVVLFYHSPFCAFCHSVAHIFLTVARTLRSVDFIEFSRIDGDNNDLPWEFTMYRYPSILFFPARRKAESRVFPSHVLLTVSTLAKFILSNLPLDERVLVMLVLCDEGARYHPPTFQDQVTMHKCITQVQLEVIKASKYRFSQYRNLMVQINMSSYENSVREFTSQASWLSIDLRYFRQVAAILLSVTHSLGGEEPISVSKAVEATRDAFSRRKAKLKSTKVGQPVDTRRLLEELHQIKTSLEELDQSISETLPKLQDSKASSPKSQRVETVNE